MAFGRLIFSILTLGFFDQSGDVQLSANLELREDGGHELREDGGFELRE